MGKYLIHYKERSIKDLTPSRESRLSGMKRGAYGNVMHGLAAICHEAGNGGYHGSC